MVPLPTPRNNFRNKVSAREFSLATKFLTVISRKTIISEK
jgi:hypothetical protein